MIKNDIQWISEKSHLCIVIPVWLSRGKIKVCLLTYLMLQIVKATNNSRTAYEQLTCAVLWRTVTTQLLFTCIKSVV